jgi:hypothetical protein
MFDDIAALFHENVVDTFESYLDTKRSGKAGRSRDLRNALAAATAMYHFREHLPATYLKSRADIVRQCPDYSLLGDVVNAGKHKGLTRGNPQLGSADQIEERLLITEYADDQGVYRHIEKQVILKLSSGVETKLLEVLINVINFWQSELAALGMISSRPSYTLPPEQQPKARADCIDGRIDFECIQGVRVKQTICLRKFNYATDEIEPFDLTGSELKFRIYKPRYDVDVSLRNDTTGHEVTRTISLSEEESQALLKYQTDQERQQYLARLPQAQGVIRELSEEVRRLQASSGEEHSGSQPTR